MVSYRRGLKHWTVEPYGIALRRNLIERVGGKRVIYDDARPRVSSEDQALHQAAHSIRSKKITDWRREQEVRLIGDFDFSMMRDEVVAIVPGANEARILRDELLVRTVCFENALN
jgi:imidazoleglycerol phosphate dehydratase HisB